MKLAQRTSISSTLVMQQPFYIITPSGLLPNSNFELHMSSPAVRAGEHLQIQYHCMPLQCLRCKHQS